MGLKLSYLFLDGKDQITGVFRLPGFFLKNRVSHCHEMNFDFSSIVFRRRIVYLYVLHRSMGSSI